tara:strand:+ start:323 stop:520 length:198 start_codon:yes stop_codon:yes gene_type:complete
MDDYEADEDKITYDMWVDVISNDLDAWDEGTLRHHLDVEGILGDEQEAIVKARSALVESNRLKDL